MDPMIHALRARDCDDARQLMGVALTLLLVFRLLLGPALAAPPEPGLVPICGGTQIVFVALDGTTGPKASEPCPFYGFAAAPATAGEPQLPSYDVAFAARLAAPILSTPGQGTRSGNSQRGPPLVV